MTLDMLQNVTGEEDVRQYLREIHSFPLLTPEEERTLAAQCAAGDENAIRKMVNSNLRLVFSIARDYAGRGLPVMDLVQEGSIGLLAAAKNFDHTREYRFSTYATKSIRQRMLVALGSHGLIRVPAHTADLIRQIQSKARALTQEKGSEPTLEELAAACEMAPARVERLMALDPQVCSLDAPVGEDDTLAVLLKNTQAQQPYETLVKEELQRIMAQLMDSLNERQQYILRHRYGLEDEKCRSLEQISRDLGISKERARQIEKQAIEKLKKIGAPMGLEDFLE